MASPIGGLDDDFLKKLLAQFGVSDSDKASAKSNSWIQTGLGLLAQSQSPYKQGLLGGAVSAVGKAGQQGMQYYDEQLNQAQARKAAAMRTGTEAMQLAGQADAFQQMQQARKLDQEYMAQQRAPAGAPPSAAPAAMGPPDPAEQQSPQSQLPPPPGPPPSQQGPAVPATLSGGMAGVNSAAAEYIKRGQFYQAHNRPDLAQKSFEEARKLMPKNKETKVMTDASGKRIMVGVDEYGQSTVLPFGPDAEKLHFADNGTGIQGLDPFNAKPVGAAIPKFQTPDSVASNQVTMRGQNMTDARARELRADSLAAQGKPQIVTGPDGNVYAVDAKSGTGKEVTGPDGKVLNKGTKPLTEQQANATAFGMRMKSANDIVNGLEDSGYNVASPKNLLAANPVSNYAASKEAQELYQAKLNFMSASLRKESGAAISQSEYDTENKKYFPQPGDSKEVIQQKRKARELALKAMDVQAATTKPAAPDSTKSRNVTVQW